MRYEVYEEILTRKDGTNAVLIATVDSYAEAHLLKGDNIHRVITPIYING